MDAESQRVAVAEWVGERSLVWFGVRGIDSQPLLAFDQFSHAFSATVPLQAASLSHEVCAEVVDRRRVDLETSDFDASATQGANALRAGLRDVSKRPAVIVPYRPVAFLSALSLRQRDAISCLGLFHEYQSAFEHKPWVETELSRIGVATIPWTYWSRADYRRMGARLPKQTTVVRQTRSSGGLGLSLLEWSGVPARVSQISEEICVAVAPYIDGAVPVNIAACVFEDGSVTLHPPSVQLIGIAALTARRFGYCGNDFAAMKNMDRKVIDALGRDAVRIGKWLSSRGYLGAFGIDMLVKGGKTLFVELNPRFQGSSLASATLDLSLGKPSIYENHIAAFAGLQPPKQTNFTADVMNCPDSAQIYAHLLSDSSCTWQMPANQSRGWTHVPCEGTEVEASAVTGRAAFDHAVTVDGYSLFPEVFGRLTKFLSGINQLGEPTTEGGGGC